jgi:hypothetical protein
MRTEDDIRAAFRDLASRAPDTAEVLAPIPAGRASVAGSARGRRQGGRRLAAALAAGTAVAGVIAASVAITSRGHPSEPASRPNHLLASVPRYYMAVEAAYPGPVSYASPSRTPPQYAVIRNTVTGAILATIRPPKPFRTFQWVAGGADDRTFVLEAAARGTDPPSAGYPAKFFRARFDPATGKVKLTALPIPEIPAGNENYAAKSFRITTIAGLALTRSETTLAVGLEVMTKHGLQTQIRVYSLDSGAVKIWRASTGNFGFGDQPRLELSWGPGGILAFNWWGQITCPELCRESADSGVRLLNTRAGGTSLIGDSRLVVRGSSGKFVADDGVLTADGQKIVTCWQVDLGPYRPHEITFEFGEYSAATGRQIRILWRAANGESLEWANSSGSVLVVQAPIISGRKSGDRDVRDVFGVLSGHRFVPIPGAPAPYLYYSDLTVLAF